MISLVDMRPAGGRPAGAQQRRLPVRHKRLAEIIDLAKTSTIRSSIIALYVGFADRSIISSLWQGSGQPGYRLGVKA